MEIRRRSGTQSGLLKGPSNLSEEDSGGGYSRSGDSMCNGKAILFLKIESGLVPDTSFLTFSIPKQSLTYFC